MSDSRKLLSCCASLCTSSELHFFSFSFRRGTTFSCRKSMISDQTGRGNYITVELLCTPVRWGVPVLTSIGQTGPVGNFGNFQSVEALLNTHRGGAAEKQHSTALTHDSCGVSGPWSDPGSVDWSLTSPNSLSNLVPVDVCHVIHAHVVQPETVIVGINNPVGDGWGETSKIPPQQTGNTSSLWSCWMSKQQSDTRTR